MTTETQERTYTKEVLYNSDSVFIAADHNHGGTTYEVRQRFRGVDSGRQAVDLLDAFQIVLKELIRSPLNDALKRLEMAVEHRPQENAMQQPTADEMLLQLDPRKGTGKK